MNAISWAEIPATDFDRAVEFYTTVLDREIEVVEIEGAPYGMFDIEESESEAGAAIAIGEQHVPSKDGTTLYLTVDGDLNAALSRVEPANGSVLISKQQLSSGAYFGMILDTEGNRIGLYSEE